MFGLRAGRALSPSIFFSAIFIFSWVLDSLAPEEAHAAEARYHIVAPGDTLHSIAERYGTTVSALVEQNDIHDPGRLSVGQRLLYARSGNAHHAAGHGAGWLAPASRPRGPRASPRLVLEPDFGRIFPAGKTAPTERGMEALKALGARMVEPRGSGPRFDSEVPAGYTFLGQFIDHDITLAVGGDLNGEQSETRLRNLRTPELDLDSVYGAGPMLSPHLYDLPHLRAGRVIYRDRHAIRRALPRLPDAGVALIGDIRNDENFIIAQLHASFIAFHNQLVDMLISHRFGYRPGEVKLTERQKRAVFEQARKHVIHYYHRLILEDYLPRLIGLARTEAIFRKGRRLYFPDGFANPDTLLFMPISFAAAAFRYGHSQVRESYTIRPGQRIDLGSDLARRGMSDRPKDLLVDWRLFFDIAERPPRGFNRARLIDPLIVRPLHRLPGFADARDPRLASLPVRNLLRSAQFNLPSGQTASRRALAERYWRDNPQILPPGSDRFLRASLGHAPTPLWYYILQEAALFGHATGFGYAREVRLSHHSGHRGFRRAAQRRRQRHAEDGARYARYGHTLGPLGGIIVGEVLIGLMDHYRATTGEGLAFRPVIRAHPHPRAGQLTLSRVVSFEGDPGPRFLMRDFLIAAGVAGPVRF